MTKIVYNACYGGFSLSDEATEMYLTRKGIEWFKGSDQYSDYYKVLHNGDYKYFDTEQIARTDPVLVEIVEELVIKARANGRNAPLRIIDLPPGTKYFIDESDGFEQIKTITNINWQTA